jgi:hypothetical protein
MRRTTLILLICIVIFSCSDNKSGNIKEDKFFETEDDILKSMEGKTYSEIAKEYGNADSYDYWGKYWKHGIKMKACDELYITFSLGALQNQTPTSVHCACSESQRKVYDELYSKQKNDIVCLAQIEWKYCFLNLSNSFISGSYKNLGNFSEGLASFGKELESASNDKQPVVYGFINASGEQVIKSVYYQVGNFHEGLCWVRSIYDTPNNFTIRYINKEGKEVFPPISRVTAPHDFCNGIVEINGKYYDTKGNIVATPTKTCKYVPTYLNDSLGLVQFGTQSSVGLQDQGYKDSYGMEVFKRVPIAGQMGYKKDSTIVIEQKYNFLGKFHYVNGVNYIKEIIGGSTKDIDTNKIPTQKNEIEPSNNLPKSNGKAIVISEKAYFYKEADLSTKKKIYIIKGQSVLYDKIEGDFIHGTYTNEQGTFTSGWFLKSNFKL